MSVNHDIDYEALAERIASDDYEPGSSVSLLDLADVMAYELLRREYEAEIARSPDSTDDEPLLRFLRRCRDDAAARLEAARAEALEAGVSARFIESVLSRESLV